MNDINWYIVAVSLWVFYALIKVSPKLIFLRKHEEEFKEFAEKQRKEKAKAAYEAAKDRLDLCERHQQKSPGTYHSAHNCDYCRLLNQTPESRSVLSQSRLIDAENQKRKDSGMNYEFTLRGDRPREN